MNEKLERYLQEMVCDGYTVKLFLKGKQKPIPLALKTPLDKRTVRRGMCYYSQECVEYVEQAKNPNVSSIEDVLSFIATRYCPNCIYYHNVQSVVFHLFH
jgi:hypothetical protein